MNRRRRGPPASAPPGPLYSLGRGNHRASPAPPADLCHPGGGARFLPAAPPTADARVTDAAFDALRAFMDDEQIVELTMVTGFYNMVSRILNTLEVDVDPPAAKDLAELGVSI